MATSYFLNAQGYVYSTSGAATSTGDSQLTVVSAAGATAITGTPASKQSVDDAVVKAAISAGTKDGQQKKYH